ncbi:MAG: arginine--tRNA ligase [Thermoproteota archaeon]|nr:arginine--tRNA ligase [Thermoproteota archaeon]
MTFSMFREEVERALKEVFQEVQDFDLEIPPLEEFGDLSSTICFKLAYKYNKTPQDLANDIKEKINKNIENFKLIKEVKAINGYLNFYMNIDRIAHIVLNEILSRKNDYGKRDIGHGKKVLIEHTNANPNKALHIGHARNTCLGDSLARILKFTNHNVIVLDYADDTGSQMADLVLGFKKLGFPLESDIRFDKYCGDQIYVKVNALYESNPSLLEEKQGIIKEIDSQAGEIAKFSKMIADRVLKEQLKTCARIGARFDIVNWESDIIKFQLLKEALSTLEERKIIHKETEGPLKGCIVIKSELIKGREKETDKVLIRSDGTTTYLAKDIGYAFWKLGISKARFKYRYRNDIAEGLLETSLEGDIDDFAYGADLAINVIDVRQSRLQDIIKSIIELTAGKEVADRYIHYKYEVVALSQKAAKELGYESDSKIVHMSSRKGVYFNVDDVLDKLKEILKKRITENNSNLDSKVVDELSEKIAVSALRYSLLRIDRNKLLIFDFDETLKIEGDSGVYVLYTYVRTKGILKKAAFKPKTDTSGYEMNDLERKLVKQLALFEEIVSKAAITLEPQTLLLYIRDLCDLFNTYYEKYPVLNADEPARSFRFKLVQCISQVLENGMNLLGLVPVEQM